MSTARTGRLRWSAAMALCATVAAAPAVAMAASNTQLVTRSATGGAANGGSVTGQLSADGRYLSMASGAKNLGPTDSNNVSDVYLMDRQAGTYDLLSVGPAGQSGNSLSGTQVSIADDGNTVVFDSKASNLLPNDPNFIDSDVFVWDRATDALQFISLNMAGQPATKGGGDPSVSADGRYVAFTSAAADLVPDDTNGIPDVFVRDRVLNTTTRVSVANDGAQATSTGFNGSATSAISDDGRVIAFRSDAQNLAGPDDDGTEADIFVRDLDKGTTTLVSSTVDGSPSNGLSQVPAISGDGKVVAFQTFSSKLVAGDTNGFSDVVARNLETGTAQIVSVRGVECGNSGDSGDPWLDRTGSTIAFGSNAANLVPGDSNANRDIFVRDMVNGVTRIASVAADDVTQTNNTSGSPFLTPDGTTLVYTSLASTLHPDDTNNNFDIFQSTPIDGVPAAPPEVSVFSAVQDPEFNPPTRTDLEFTLELSQPVCAGTTASVRLSTSDETAIAGADYEATSKVVTFAPGVTQVTVSVPVIGDLADEADETFGVTLSEPAGLTIGTGNATGTIIDDDLPAPLGTLSCQSTAATLLGRDFAVANPQDDPCRSDFQRVLRVDQPLGGLNRITLGVLESTTVSKLTSGTSQAGIATVALRLAGLTLGAEGIFSRASVTCVNGKAVLASESGGIVAVNGRRIVDGAPFSLNLGLVAVHINREIRTADEVVRRSIEISAPLLGIHIVLAEARADVHGNACPTL